MMVLPSTRLAPIAFLLALGACSSETEHDPGFSLKVGEPILLGATRTRTFVNDLKSALSDGQVLVAFSQSHLGGPGSIAVQRFDADSRAREPSAIVVPESVGGVPLQIVSYSGGWVLSWLNYQYPGRLRHTFFSSGGQIEATIDGTAALDRNGTFITSKPTPEGLWTWIAVCDGARLCDVRRYHTRRDGLSEPPIELVSDEPIEGPVGVVGDSGGAFSWRRAGTNLKQLEIIFVDADGLARSETTAIGPLSLGAPKSIAAHGNDAYLITDSHLLYVSQGGLVREQTNRGGRSVVQADGQFVTLLSSEGDAMIQPIHPDGSQLAGCRTSASPSRMAQLVSEGEDARALWIEGEAPNSWFLRMVDLSCAGDREWQFAPTDFAFVSFAGRTVWNASGGMTAYFTGTWPTDHEAGPMFLMPLDLQGRSRSDPVPIESLYSLVATPETFWIQTPGRLRALAPDGSELGAIDVDRGRPIWAGDRGWLVRYPDRGDNSTTLELLAMDPRLNPLGPAFVSTVSGFIADVTPATDGLFLLTVLDAPSAVLAPTTGILTPVPELENEIGAVSCGPSCWLTPNNRVEVVEGAVVVTPSLGPAGGTISGDFLLEHSRNLTLYDRRANDLLAEAAWPAEEIASPHTGAGAEAPQVSAVSASRFALTYAGDEQGVLGNFLRFVDVVDNGPQ